MAAGALLRACALLALGSCGSGEGGGAEWGDEVPGRAPQDAAPKDPWSATGLGVLNLPRTADATQHMREKMHAIKTEAAAAESAHRRRRLENTGVEHAVVEHTLALLKPDFVKKKGEMGIARLLSRLQHEGFRVIRQKMLAPAMPPCATPTPTPRSCPPQFSAPTVLTSMLTAAGLSGRAGRQRGSCTRSTRIAPSSRS